LEVKYAYKKRQLGVASLALVLFVAQSAIPGFAQGIGPADVNLVLKTLTNVASYVDPERGMTAEEAVAYALEHNDDLLAARKQIDAASALVKQASLHANPMLEIRGAKQIVGGDRNFMASGSLPLELGGRRTARISVAQRELELREHLVADRERLLAAEVRAKFGVALAEIYKLGLTDELVTANEKSYRLVAARVTEGNSAPLEQNIMLVELNRMRSLRQTGDGKVQVAMLDLRNSLGMDPDTPLRLRGSLTQFPGEPSPVSEVVENALASRPDILAARSAERVAEAQIEQARAEGRPDAALTAGYQRMKAGFPLNGITDNGDVRPIMNTMNFLTAGVTINLPVLNQNQGTIQATIAEAEAAKHRREFAELTLRREIASAYAKYQSAARAMEIFRVGVQEQASTNLDVVRRTYELGARTLIDYIAEERRYIELESSYIDVVLETYLARVDIARASASPELMKK
jgi:outer membrane protein, heavy metal efflux system